MALWVLCEDAENVPTLAGTDAHHLHLIASAVNEKFADPALNDE
jgi:hypothetical protein